MPSESREGAWCVGGAQAGVGGSKEVSSVCIEHEQGWVWSSLSVVAYYTYICAAANSEMVFILVLNWDSTFP